MQAILSLRCPALGAYTFEQQDGLLVSGLAVDALHQLVSQDTGAGILTGVAEVDLGIDIVLPCLVHPHLSVLIGDVLKMGMYGSVFPLSDGVLAGLGELPEVL